MTKHFPHALCLGLSGLFLPVPTLSATETAIPIAKILQTTTKTGFKSEGHILNAMAHNPVACCSDPAYVFSMTLLLSQLAIVGIAAVMLKLAQPILDAFKRRIRSIIARKPLDLWADK